MKRTTMVAWLFIFYLSMDPFFHVNAADGSESLGIFQDWSAAAYTDGHHSGCYIVSVPKSEKGKYTKRGDVYVLVTRSPSIGAGIVSFHAGYPFGEDAEVSVNIDGDEMILFTDKETAWAYQGDDKLFIQKMRNGKKMIVVGFSKRGTKTTDTYSLFGFTQAYETILEHSQCK